MRSQTIPPTSAANTTGVSMTCASMTPLADRARDVRLEDQERAEVEERGPDDRVARRQDPRRDYRRDRVGGVVESVDEVERERHQDDAGDCQRHGSGVLEDDALDHVGDVFAPVGGVLERLVHLLPLEDEEGILRPAEELGERAAQELVALVLPAAHLDAGVEEN